MTTNTIVDQEVARRCLTIERLVKSQDGATVREVTSNEVAIEIATGPRVVELRRRLSHVSCFMKPLSGYERIRSRSASQCCREEQDATVGNRDGSSSYRNASDRRPVR